MLKIEIRGTGRISGLALLSFGVAISWHINPTWETICTKLAETR